MVTQVDQCACFTVEHQGVAKASTAQLYIWFANTIAEDNSVLAKYTEIVDARK